MLLTVNDNLNVLKWLEKKDDKFTSPTIQNGFLEIMVMKIPTEVKGKSKFH